MINTAEQCGPVKGANPNERQRRIWQRHAPVYDRQIRVSERLLFPDGRSWACSQAAGDVLEVAIGTGLNLPHYPRGITLTGIDLSPAMLAIACDRARALGVDADLREASADALPFPDASFDTVVCTVSLCNIPDDRGAIAEMYRVLRVGGSAVIEDLCQDATVADIDAEVAAMGQGPVNAMMTKVALIGLRRRAYSPARFRQLVADSPFRTCEIHRRGVGMSVRMTKRPADEAG